MDIPVANSSRSRIQNTDPTRYSSFIYPSVFDPEFPTLHGAPLPNTTALYSLSPSDGIWYSVSSSVREGLDEASQRSHLTKRTFRKMKIQKHLPITNGTLDLFIFKCLFIYGSIFEIHKSKIHFSDNARNFFVY
jgi:hypothetical protein